MIENFNNSHNPHNYFYALGQKLKRDEQEPLKVSDWSQPIKILMGLGGLMLMILNTFLLYKIWALLVILANK